MMTIVLGNHDANAIGLPDEISAALPSSSALPTSSFLVDLGAFNIKVSVPPSAQSVTRFFQRVRPLQDGEAVEHRFEVVLVGVQGADIASSTALCQLLDASYRSIRLQRGYYVTEHFGRPSGMIVRGNCYFFFTDEFDKLVWGYLVKALLTRFAVETERLHLKAAAFVCDGAGTLVIGRGGGGKTVLCGTMCDYGSDWVTNTHALLDGTNCTGVLSRLKVRDRPHAIAGDPPNAVIPAILPGESLVDPARLGWSVRPSCALSTLLIVDFASGQRRIAGVSSGFAYAIAEQFGLAINVYGQKEDYWDYIVPGAQAFVERLDTERDMLRRLTETLCCLHVSIDMLDATSPRALAKRLAR